MVGIIHRDKESPPLLLALMEKIKPHVVTLEFSHYGMRFRQRRGEELKKTIDDAVAILSASIPFVNREAVSSLYAYVEMPYEYEVAKQYCDDHAIPLHLIDMDIFSYERLQHIEELLSLDNIQKMLVAPERKGTVQEKALAQLFFEKGMRVVPYTEEMYVRDEYMSRRIQHVMASHTDMRLLHICGWHHLQDPYHVYDHLNPVKVFVYDQTVCF